MTDNKQPIGIFDSGIGGLTVAGAIKKKLPHERLIYFGDTAHLPYGEKSAEAISHFSMKITDFLMTQNCKAIVIACNTASSIAYEQVQEGLRGKAIAFNVIDPVVRYVSENCGQCRVGIIGTRATIGTGAYEQGLKKRNSGIETVSLATPLLAPMIEEGFFNNSISKVVIGSYLSNKLLEDIDKLILACTHYPLIEKQIKHYYGDQAVEIINSANLVAEHVALSLQAENKCASSPAHEDDHFYVSDFTYSFEQSARHFFSKKVQLEEVKLWQ